MEQQEASFQIENPIKHLKELKISVNLWGDEKRKRVKNRFLL